MTDLIILGIVVCIIALGFRSGMQHFRGEGGCCGGSTYKAKKKKLHQVVTQKVFQVEGMSCQHCVNRVMEAVNAVDGASAVVHLKKGTVTVSMEKEIEDAVIRDAIEEAGYKVIKILDR